MAERDEPVEGRDIDTPAVLKTAGAVVICIALAIAAAVRLLAYWQASQGNGPDVPAPLQQAARSAQPPAPQSERDAYFAEKAKLLNSWQWVDRRAGRVRIPIDVAMDLMARRGAGP